MALFIATLFSVYRRAIELSDILIVLIELGYSRTTFSISSLIKLCIAFSWMVYIPNILILASLHLPSIYRFTCYVLDINRPIEFR